MKKIIIFILILIFIDLSAQNTQNIRGSVIDRDSDFPLPGAEISIDKNGKIYGAVTNFDGEYIIKNVPVGKISIKVTYIGYENQSFYNLDLETGKELVVNFRLTEKINTLKTVVIKSTGKKDQMVFSVNSNVTLSVKQINRYAGSLGDVSRMAMNYAGVSLNNDSQNNIIVRGNNSNSLLWSMEGIPIPNPNHYSASGTSGGPVSMINTNILGRSNFLSGAFPANFGNTTSAVFDLEFRKGNKDKYEFVGQIGFAGAELGAEGPIKRKDKSSFIINYRYSTLELFDKLGINYGIGIAVPKYQDASFIIDLPTKKNGKFRVWSIAGISKINIKTSDEGGDNAYLDYAKSDLNTNNLTVISGINNKYFFNKKTSLFTGFSYSKLEQKVKLDTLNTNTNNFENLYNQNIMTDFITGKIELKSKRNAKNTFAVGSDYTSFITNLNMVVHKPSYNYNNVLDETIGLWGSYINYKHSFSDKLIMKAGVRMNYLNLNNEMSIEPRFGINYKPNKKISISFAYGLHSNMQPVLAYFSKHIENSKEIYKNKNLRFTKSHHLVLGLKNRIANKLNLKSEIYFQYLFNVPVYLNGDKTYSIINSGYLDPGGVQSYFYPLSNRGKGKNYGLDLTLEYPLNKGFYFLLTGSIYNSQYRPANNIWYSTAWNGNYMTSVLLGKEFVFSDKRSLYFDINLNYSGGRRFTPIDKQASMIAGEAIYIKDDVFFKRLPEYFRTDLKISYKLNGKKITQEIQISLRNIFNHKNIFSQRYNKYKQDVEYIYQMGFFPVGQYRILF